MPAARNTQQDILFHQILAEFKEMNSEIAGLRVEMENFKETLEPIARIIRGDGVVQSLSTQIEVMRTEMTHVMTTMTKIEAKTKDIEDRVDKGEQEDKKGRWALLTATTTGVLSLAGTIIAVIIALAKK